MELIAIAVYVSAIVRSEALVAGVAAILWLVIIAVLHVIKPELEPSMHMISEYARKPKGWIMQLAFFCMAVACLAVVLATWTLLPHFGLVLLAIVGVSFAGAGAFVTDPRFMPKGAITKDGVLHNVFSFIVIPLFPIAAAIVSVSVPNNSVWGAIHLWLLVLSALTWVGFIGFMSSAIYSASHKEMPVGYFQRFMVLTYAAWLIAIAFAMT